MKQSNINRLERAHKLLEKAEGILSDAYEKLQDEDDRHGVSNTPVWMIVEDTFLTVQNERRYLEYIIKEAKERVQ